MFLALKNCGNQKEKRIIKVILSYIPKAFILPGIISLNSKQNSIFKYRPFGKTINAIEGYQ